MNYKSTLAFFLISPSIISVFLAIFNIPLPAELTVCTVSFFGLFLIKLKSKKYAISSAGGNFTVFILLFCSILAFYTIYSLSSSFVYAKIVLIGYLIFLKLLVVSLVDFKIIFNQYDSFVLKLKSYASVVIFLFLILFILGFTENPDSADRKYLVGIGNPIWFSRFVLDLLFIVVYFTFRRKKFTLINLGVISCGLYLVFVSGSRGPVLSFLIVCFLCSLYCFPNIKKKLFIIVSLFIIFAAPFIVPIVMDFNMYSVMERLEHIRISTEFIKNNLFGYGLGAYGQLSLGVDERAYPHNIFIEIFLELGLVGLLSFISLIGYGVLTRSKDNIFFFLFIMSLLNAQFSGDLASNGYTFLYLYLSIIYFRLGRKKYEPLPLCHGKYGK